MKCWFISCDLFLAYSFLFSCLFLEFAPIALVNSTDQSGRLHWHFCLFTAGAF